MNDRSFSPEPPQVSVVIPAYNCDRFIEHTLHSIQAQTLDHWECIIVDDGSTDDTLSLIQRFAAEDPRFQIATQPNAGPSSARNHGLSLIHPRSQFVTFMDSDDLWLPGALEALKTEIEKYPEAAGAHAMGRCIDVQGAEHEDPAYVTHGHGRIVLDDSGAITTLDPSAPTSFRSLWYSNPFPPGLILTRRSAYEKAGAFDAAVCPVEDWDMIIRLSRHGDYRFVDKVLLSYRRHDQNLSGQSATVNERQIRSLLYKTFFSPDNSPVQQRIAMRNWRATEMMHLRQRVIRLKESLASFNIAGVLSAIASGFVHLWRFARGYPTISDFEPLPKVPFPRGKAPAEAVSHNPT